MNRRFQIQSHAKCHARAVAGSGIGGSASIWVVRRAAALAQSGKPIYQSDSFSIWPDHVVEGNYSAYAPSTSEIDSDYQSPDGTRGGKWVLQTDLSQYPQTHSEYPLLDALYNLSLEELSKDTREDGAFNAGAKWEGYGRGT